MGAVSAVADAVVALFSLIMAVGAPLFDSQVVLPLTLYPEPLVDIFRWFIAEFDHYLARDPPPFFRGLVWLDLALLWPVSVANIYGILTRRRWSATTSLMAGVHMLTYLFAIFGEMFSSGRATPKLILLYVPCLCCNFSYAWSLLMLRTDLARLVGCGPSCSEEEGVDSSLFM